MRVLRVVTQTSRSGEYGGPSDTARAQCELLSSAGVQCVLLSGYRVDDRADHPTPNFEEKAVECRSLIPSLKFITFGSLAITRVIVHEVRHADAVHVSFAREFIPLMTAFVAVITRTRLVLQPHGMLTARTSRVLSLLDALFIRRLFNISDAAIALTAHEKAQLLEWAKGKRAHDRIVVLGNPLRRDALAAVADSPATPVRKGALFLARLHERKRVGDFLAAGEIAWEQGWPETYSVVGPDQGDLALVEQALARCPSIAYEGSVSPTDVLERVRQAQVFVLCSESEPWGNVLLGALHTGTPVVVTESSALADEIRRWGAGVVVPDRDPQAIAHAVHRIAHGEALTYSEKSRQLANHLIDPKVMTNVLLRTYATKEDS